MQIEKIRRDKQLRLVLPAKNKSKDRLKLPVSTGPDGNILWDQKTPKSLRKGSIAKEQHSLWTEIRDHCKATGEGFDWFVVSKGDGKGGLADGQVVQGRGNSGLHLNLEDLDRIVERFN